MFSKKEAFRLLFFLFFITVIVFTSRSYRLNHPGAIQMEDRAVLLIPERIGLNDLSNLMQDSGFDFDRDELIWAGESLRWRSFHPGRYEFNEPQSYNNFLSKIARGMQDPARVTILPGSDPGRFARHLSLQMRADSTEFASHFADSSVIALEKGVSGEVLFSRMMPNSYDFYWTSSPENVIRRLYREFERSVDRYSDEVDSHDLSLNEIVILASIVEWEARHDSEKPKISGLYLNRLNRNMMLQADPTVAYALGERRRLFFEDYRVDHPYNTYQITGLPPGPITNPSLSTILSVLRPEEHDYLFMVATPDGSHQFSRTFEEHRQASAEWRRWLREQYRIRDEREQGR